jgi:Leucine-rich repeat (LRR) protein
MKKIFFILTFIISLQGYTQVNVQDSLALVTFYNSTNGPNWTCGCNLNWLNTPVNQWQGVTVENGRVTKLIIVASMSCTEGCSMSGSLPVEIGNLIKMTDLYLAGNQNLTGPIPAEIGNVDSLKNLNLSRTGINGSLPPSLFNIPNLQALHLNQTGLSGSIPPEIGNAHNLYYLDLNSCNFSGTIPPEIGNDTLLTTVSINENNLTGSIPPEIGNLKSLINLGLYNNFLSGSLPAGIGNLQFLYSLFLGRNLLTGSIPLEFGNLANLHELALDNNQLVGKIPITINQLNNLQMLYLNNNNFTDSLPDAIGAFPSIHNISINNNQFSYIPDFSSVPWYISALEVENNKLEFDDIEKNISLAGTADTFTYSPQDSVNISIDTTVALNSLLQLQTIVGGLNNNYQWYHNGTQITGATDSILTLTVTPVETGNYTCQITNTIVTGLILWRKRIHVGIITSILNENIENFCSVINNNGIVYINMNKTQCGDLLIQLNDISGKELFSDILPEGNCCYNFSTLRYNTKSFVLFIGNENINYKKIIVN